jgi:hypothetical protein
VSSAPGPVTKKAEIGLARLSAAGSSVATLRRYRPHASCAPGRSAERLR